MLVETLLLSSNETPTWCNTVQVLFLQSHSTCFGRKRPSSRVFKTSTAATGTCVIVAGKSSHFLIRAGTVEWLCRNKTCTVLYQVGVSFDLYYDARKHKIKILLLPLSLQPSEGLGLSYNVLPFFPICHQLSPSSHSQHLKISVYSLFPSFPESSPFSRPFQFLSEDFLGASYPPSLSLGDLTTRYCIGHG